LEPDGGIVQIADISVGYGNYDSISLVRSVRDHYRLPAVILEPDQWDKPIREDVDGMKPRRIPLSSQFRTNTGRVEFILKAAAQINAMRPRILIVRCSWNIPVLLKLNYRPSLVIYHSTESTLYYGPRDPAINRLAAPLIDVVVYPEENRAIRDVQRCGFRKLPVAIAYNCPIPRADAERVVPPASRNGRILYSGALDRHATYTDYYAEPAARSLPIDVYGYIAGWDADRTRTILESVQGNVRYKGFVEAEELEAARGKYAFSLTIWNPSNENQLYACPCKFFESIAALVPPIAAPHPQCKMLIERYGCGIVMEDWTFRAFQEAVSKALALYGSRQYDDMVSRCKQAMLAELNWDHQFEKVRPLLPGSL
jgi:glycosyltransferase involved in cell wall biosynthesis